MPQFRDLPAEYLLNASLKLETSNSEQFRALLTISSGPDKIGLGMFSVTLALKEFFLEFEIDGALAPEESWKYRGDTIEELEMTFKETDVSEINDKVEGEINFLRIGKISGQKAKKFASSKEISYKRLLKTIATYGNKEKIRMRFKCPDRHSFFAGLIMENENIFSIVDDIKSDVGLRKVDIYCSFEKHGLIIINSMDHSKPQKMNNFNLASIFLRRKLSRRRFLLTSITHEKGR